MRIVIAAVGKPRDRHLAAAIAEYEMRASRYWPLEVAEVREGSGRGVDPEQARLTEAARLLERVPSAANLIACDERGASLTSAEFARLISDARDRAEDVAFAVGGAFGLGQPVHARAVRSIQLAPFTLPHEMARLVLAEQLYRAGTIARGEPYHK